MRCCIMIDILTDHECIGIVTENIMILEWSPLHNGVLCAGVISLLWVFHGGGELMERSCFTLTEHCLLSHAMIAPRCDPRPGEWNLFFHHSESLTGLFWASWWALSKSEAMILCYHAWLSGHPCGLWRIAQIHINGSQTLDSPLVGSIFLYWFSSISGWIIKLRDQLSPFAYLICSNKHPSSVIITCHCKNAVVFAVFESCLELCSLAKIHANVISHSIPRPPCFSN